MTGVTGTGFTGTAVMFSEYALHVANAANKSAKTRAGFIMQPPI
jgi:hypothetical protein